MRQKRAPPFLVVISVLVLTTIACAMCTSQRSEQYAQQTLTVQAETRSVEELYHTQTREAELTIVALTPQSTVTPTPECHGDYIHIGGGHYVCQSNPFYTAIPEFTPSPPGTYTIPSSKAWYWYYDEDDNKLLLVKGGTSWPGQDSSFSFTGWVPDFDSNLNEDEAGGVTRCDPHRWDHAGNQQQCHTHIIGENSTENEIDILAQIPADWEFAVVPDTISKRWVKDKNGISVYAQGRVVTFEYRVRVRQ